MSDWTLAIDFGTTFTAAALRSGDRCELVDIEGDGSLRMESCVWLDDAGTFIVGKAARHQAVFAPDRFEPTPKRCVGEGEIVLGVRMVRVVDCIAAVLRRATGAAVQTRGGQPPSSVRLTHPADWAQTRTDVLRGAAGSAGLHDLVLIPEPVAAAFQIGATDAAVGEHVAVYDFGGGTFDAAVLRRTHTGFEVAGPPGGRDPLGGEDIDQRIVDHLGAGPLGELPDWQLLVAPTDLRWRQASAGLRAEVRRAKEGLSHAQAWRLWVPGIEREVQLTRAELESLIRADVDLTADIMVATIAAAGLTPADVRGAYLVGGSSRIPLIARTVWERMGVPPRTYEDPKAVVALGATAAADAGEAAVAIAPAAASPPPAPWPLAASAAGTALEGAPPPPPAMPAGRPGSAAQSPLPSLLAAGGSPSPPVAGAPPLSPAGATVPVIGRRPAKPPRRLLIASGAGAAAVLVVAGLLIVPRLGGSPAPTGVRTQPAATGSAATTATSSQPLSKSQLALALLGPQDVGTGFTDTGKSDSLSDVRPCDSAPQLVGLSGEAVKVYGDGGSQSVLVDDAAFSGDGAHQFLAGIASALQTCNGNWVTTIPGTSNQAQVSATLQQGAALGDETVRLQVTYAGTNGSVEQDLVFVRVGADVAAVVYSAPTGNLDTTSQLAGTAAQRLKRATG